MNEEIKKMFLEEKDCMINENGLAMIVIDASNLPVAMEKFYFYLTITDAPKEVRLAAARAVCKNAPELVLELMKKHKQGDRGIIINWNEE